MLGLSFSCWTRIARRGPPSLPQVLTPPSLNGPGEVGSTLLIAPGTYSGSPVLSFSWLRDGVAIDGAETPDYPVAPQDAGTLISAIVTATNTAGSREVVAGIVQIAPAAPLPAWEIDVPADDTVRVVRSPAPPAAPEAVVSADIIRIQ